MKYRVAAFDFDGTLADSFSWLVGVMDELANRYKFKPIAHSDPEVLRGYSSRQLLAHLGIPMWKVPRMAAYARKLQARDIDQIKLFEGVSDMLTGLAQNGVDIGIISSNSEQNVRSVLGADNAALIKRYGCGASLLGKRAKLSALLRACRASPAAAIYIGDEIRDIEAAAGVGMASGAVSWGYARLDALQAASPTEVFQTPLELVQRLVRR